MRGEEIGGGIGAEEILGVELPCCMLLESKSKIK
jgi:hypothetical protein